LPSTIQNITLISFGNFEKNLLEQVVAAVQSGFHREVVLKDGAMELINYYDPSRRQYNGDLLLKKIDALRETTDGKVIGLFQVDLFIPILTYIFGQAFLNGSTGIASIYRLYNERYGLPPNETLLVERFQKEVVHELGHAFGLIHCPTPTCVMRSSTYVEDIDQKSVRFCNSCNVQLGACRTI
jgi:archaemetzincin